MTVYKSSNGPGRRLLRELVFVVRWLTVIVLCGVAVLLVGSLFAAGMAGQQYPWDVQWLLVAVVVVVLAAAAVIPPPRRTWPATPVPPPAAADCVAPTAEYVVGTDTVMTPQALEQLWRASPSTPRIRPAAPDGTDGQAGAGRG